jgi:exopolyphosphatase/guanosine-5'-triphosphate,3'-diphosphate pyrophosphatase
LVSREGLDWLLEKLISAQSIDRIRMPGMREDRRAIIGGGVSVLRAVFDLLQIDQLHQASGGLRHGLICDLMGNASDQTDLRSMSIERLAAKFGTDQVHSQRVGKVANQMLLQLKNQASTLENQTGNLSYERLNRQLNWAAQLHEIGSQISHSDYHKHGAYILDNTDAMGFSLTELHKLSQLVLGHRGKLRKLEADFEDEMFVQQLLALRLAVILCHARRDPDLNGITLERETNNPKNFRVDYRSNWAQTYPQSAHLLREEVLAWQKTPWTLSLREY